MSVTGRMVGIGAVVLEMGDVSSVEGETGSNCGG